MDGRLLPYFLFVNLRAVFLFFENHSQTKIQDINCIRVGQEPSAHRSLVSMLLVEEIIRICFECLYITSLCGKLHIDVLRAVSEL